MSRTSSRIIYRYPDLAKGIPSFCLSVAPDAGGTPRGRVALELDPVEHHDEPWHRDAERPIQADLRGMNRDYAKAIVEYPAAMAPLRRIWS
jgi:hypothetical protein